MSDIDIVGDVVRFDGHDVARLSPGVPPTTQDRFREWLFGTDGVEDNGPLLISIFEELLVLAKTKAQAGLLSIDELEASIDAVESRHT